MHDHPRMRLHRHVQHHLFRTPKRTAISFTTIFSVVGITGLLILQLATRPPTPQPTNAASLTVPAALPLYAGGVDVSAWNTGRVPSGVRFGVARATYGTYPDPLYGFHALDIRGRGLVLGAYTFGVNADGGAQARALLSVAGSASFLALDWESNDGATMTTAEARAFIAAIHATGRRVGLYHSASGFPNVGQDWNWVAQWSAAPPTVPWTIWQWTSGGLDRDVFAGGTIALLAFSSDQALVPSTGLTVTAATTPAEARGMRTYLLAVEGTLTRYVTNLASLAHPSAYQLAELSAYRQRRAAVVADVRFLDAVLTLDGYIDRLRLVAHPSAYQRAERTRYVDRLYSWLPRAL